GRAGRLRPADLFRSILCRSVWCRSLRRHFRGGLELEAVAVQAELAEHFGRLLVYDHDGRDARRLEVQRPVAPCQVEQAALPMVNGSIQAPVRGGWCRRWRRRGAGGYGGRWCGAHGKTDYNAIRTVVPLLIMRLWPICIHRARRYTSAGGKPYF